ncbi:MAG: RNA polymerase sigma factor [Coprobacillaceae bacterium]
MYVVIVKKVYYWCYTVIGNDEDCLDASQEAMIQIYRKIHTLKEPKAFNSWMYRVVRNSCYSYLKSHKKEDKELIYNDDFTESFESKIEEERRDNLPKEAYDLKETKQLIAKFINNLPRRQREIITLYYLEELKSDEIASVLNISAGAVRSRLYDGRKSLELQIKEYQDKSQIRLYNIAWIPMLGLILQEHREEVCSKQTFEFPNIHKQLTKITRIKHLLSKPFFLITVIVCIVVVTTITLKSVENQNNSTALPISVIDLINADKKAKGFQWIEKIEVLEFPLRNNVPVNIVCQKDIRDEDIVVFYNGIVVPHNKDDRNVSFLAEGNGIYKVRIKDEETTVTINNLDDKAPELVEVRVYAEYLQIIIDDSLSQINYNHSYLEYNQERYPLIEDGKINTNIRGEVFVVLFNQERQFIKYALIIN